MFARHCVVGAGASELPDGGALAKAPKRPAATYYAFCIPASIQYGIARVKSDMNICHSRTASFMLLNSDFGVDDYQVTIVDVDWPVMSVLRASHFASAVKGIQCAS